MMFHKAFRFFFMVPLVALLMTGCDDSELSAGKTAEQTQEQASLTETYWKLTELMGNPVPPSDNEAHMILKTEDARVAGSSGCNRMMGGYELKEPGQIHFTQMAGTRMACANGMETEQQFLDVLGKADSYTINGQTLQLNRAKMAPLAKFEAVYLN